MPLKACLITHLTCFAYVPVLYLGNFKTLEITLSGKGTFLAINKLITLFVLSFLVS